jgi:hypothetical protein
LQHLATAGAVFSLVPFSLPLNRLLAGGTVLGLGEETQAFAGNRRSATAARGGRRPILVPPLVPHLLAAEPHRAAVIAGETRLGRLEQLPHCLVVEVAVSFQHPELSQHGRE